MKKMVRFNSSLLATAASSATAAAEFLAELQAEVDRALALASEEELLAARLQFAKSFPIGDILLLLEQQPTVMDQGKDSPFAFQSRLERSKKGLSSGIVDNEFESQMIKCSHI